MGKTKRGEKERSNEQRLKYENQKLRKEVGALRKQLARVDLDRHSYVREIVEEHLAQEDQVPEQSTQETLDSLKRKWQCRECQMGHLEIHTFSKMGETWYYRHCSNCEHRTKAQAYTPSVEGIVKEFAPPPVKGDKKGRN